MSGGFFRGTSADQDTRFSNKQAKLLKTQKFAPELENLVDMTKVKMDVMRPWIAHRVTELLGFEDEVLINFIYGLLEEKVVNGKEIQISLTGFMEKNTGRFMKELWTHLLSAQKNASGVPQQFLDAKEEETRKKQADTDRIASELKRMKEKEKEGRELELEKMKKMDGEVDDLQGDALEPYSRSHARASSKWSVNEKEANDMNGSRGRNRISRSPRPADRSPSPRGTRSRSISKSFSNSRSHSRSRSLSMSPKREQRSVSSERRRVSPSRRSVTPRRGGSPARSPYPSKHGSSRSRRRSVSRSRLRSPSPVRRRFRSPLRRRSRSPLRRRSRSPMWRRSRSPFRRRSRSPIRRRSRTPIRRRSRSPMRRRSRSPLRRRSRSPMRYRSRSPVGRKSRSPLRRRSLSPRHPRSPSPVRRRSPSPGRQRYRRAPSTPRHRSPSPMRRRRTFPDHKISPSSESMSPSPDKQTSQSPIRRSPLGRRSPRRQLRSPMQSSRDGQRVVEKNSPGRHTGRKESDEQPAEGRKRSGSIGRRSPFSVRSPERDPRGRKVSHNRDRVSSSSPYRSPPSSGSPPAIRRRSPSEERSLTPTRQRVSLPINDSPKSVEVEDKRISRAQEDRKPNSLGKMIKPSSTTAENEDLVDEKRSKKTYSPEKLASHHSSEIQAQKKWSEYDVGRTSYPAFAEGSSPDILRDMPSDRIRNSDKGCKKVDETNDIKDSGRHHEAANLHKLSRKVGRNDRSGSLDSESEETDERRGDINEKRKRKRSKRKDVTSDDDSSDSHVEDRKEAKRRRKEEKKLKKEERRRRREERRRRKEDRRSEKLKLKAGGNVSQPSESENNHAGYAADGEPTTKRAVDNEESDQKKLEIELREKALESLRAKKGLTH